jgi:hypothetical protein
MKQIDGAALMMSGLARAGLPRAELGADVASGGHKATGTHPCEIVDPIFNNLAYNSADFY